jgi:hypothetical protein
MSTTSLKNAHKKPQGIIPAAFKEKMIYFSRHKNATGHNLPAAWIGIIVSKLHLAIPFHRSNVFLFDMKFSFLIQLTFSSFNLLYRIFSLTLVIITTFIPIVNLFLLILPKKIKKEKNA